MILIPRRRRLEGKTNYTKRKKLLEGRKPRIIIRKSNKYITIQYIESRLAQDSVKVSVISKDLLEYGWPKDECGSLKSLGAAYLTGVLFAKKAKGLKEAILDTGLIRSTKGSRLYAALMGIVEGGFKTAHNTKMFPEEKRVKTQEFFDKVKGAITK
jgi:large subunit ribosomal protein L18